MAGCRLAFDRNNIQLHQVLCAKLTDDGQSGMALRPDWETPATREEAPSLS
jgi:cyclopropane-fatty-acyl-phospholipid synthase